MIDSNELTRKIKTPLNPRAALIAYALKGTRTSSLKSGVLTTGET